MGSAISASLLSKRTAVALGSSTCSYFHAMLTRNRAIEILDREHAQVLELVERLPAATRTVTGIGGGEWSAKDLLGHLETWEELALDAVEHWERELPAP